MDMTIKSRSFAVGLFISASLLSFGDSITQAPAPTSSAVGQQLAASDPAGGQSRDEAEKRVNEHLKELDKPYMAPYKKLNDAGRSDLTKNENAGAAFDALMYTSHPFKVHPEVTSLLRGAIASVEAKYWSGESKGVTEDELATTINNLATKLNMPKGAATTRSQVRLMRQLEEI